MSKTILKFLLATLVVGRATANIAFAQEGTITVTPSQLAEKPDIYTGKMVRVRRMRCVDVDYGFTCRVKAPPFVVKIDTRALGKMATDSASTRLAEKCKGEGALKTRACEFDVVVKPISNDYTILPEGSVVRIVADDLDVF